MGTMPESLSGPLSEAELQEIETKCARFKNAMLSANQVERLLAELRDLRAMKTGKEEATS